MKVFVLSILFLIGACVSAMADPPLVLSVKETIEVTGPLSPGCSEGDENPGMSYVAELVWTGTQPGDTYLLHVDGDAGSPIGSVTSHHLVTILSVDHHCFGLPAFWDFVNDFRASLTGKTYQLEVESTGQLGPVLTMPSPTLDATVVLVPGISPSPPFFSGCNDPTYALDQFEALKNSLISKGLSGSNIVIAGTAGDGFDPRADQTTKAQQLKDIIDFVSPSGPVHIVGYSEGGPVALLYHNLNPGRVSRMVSVGSPFGGSHIANGSVLLHDDPQALEPVLNRLCLSTPQLADLSTPGAVKLNRLRPQTPDDMLTIDGTVNGARIGTVPIPPFITRQLGDGVVRNSSSRIAGVENYNVTDGGTDALSLHTRLLEQSRVHDRIFARLTKPPYPPPGDPPLPTQLDLIWSSAAAESDLSLVFADAVDLTAGETHTVPFIVHSNDTFAVRIFGLDESGGATLYDPGGILIESVNTLNHIFVADIPATGIWTIDLSNSIVDDTIVLLTQYTVSTTSAELTLDPSFTVAEVTLVGPAAEVPTAVTGTLQLIPGTERSPLLFADDGVSPDALPDDGIFTASLDAASTPGNYGLVATALVEVGSSITTQRTVMGFGEVNTPAVANPDSLTVNIGDSGSGDVLANDTDADNHPLTADLVDVPTNGTVSLSPDGNFTYTHDGSQNLSDSFTYVANDGFSDSNVADVTVTVNTQPTADASATEQVVVFKRGKTAEVTLDGSRSSDLEDANVDLIFEWFLNGSQLVTGEFATVTFPKGTYVFDLNVTDTAGLSSSDTVTVTVTKSGGGRGGGGGGKDCAVNDPRPKCNR